MLQSSCFQLCAVIGLFCSAAKAARLFKPRKKLCITIRTVFEETIKHFLYIVHPLPLPPKLIIETEEEKAVNDV